MAGFGIRPTEAGLITVLKTLGGPLSLKMGEIIEARVVDLLPDGGVTLNLKGTVLTARAEIQFLKDTFVKLKVLGTDSSGGQLRLQFIGEAEHQATILSPKDISSGNTLAKIVRTFSEVISNNGSTPERVMDAVEQLLKALPPDMRSVPREIRLQLQSLLHEYTRNSGENITSGLDRLVKTLPGDFPEGDRIKQTLKVFQREIEDISGGPDRMPLREALNRTGVTLEAKLKALASLMRMPASPDLAEIKTDLKTQLLLLKESPAADRGSSELVSGLLKDIETFQLISRVTDSFCTFLPVFWEQMKNGDISFRKGGKDTPAGSYSCRINLDLDRLGELSVIVLMNNREFFVYFRTDSDSLKDAMSASLDELGKGFAASGLRLRGTLFLDKDIPVEDMEKLQSFGGKVNIRI